MRLAPASPTSSNFTTTNAGEYVEEYSDDGHFVRVCYTPQGFYHDPSWQREESADGLSRVFRGCRFLPALVGWTRRWRRLGGKRSYLYRLEAAGISATHIMTLLR